MLIKPLGILGNIDDYSPYIFAIFLKNFRPDEY
jgi:hypothetical protein